MFNPMGQANPQDLGNGGEIDGDLSVTGDLTVSGGIGLTLSEVIEGTSTIDVDSTEALLVRKNGDGGDIFTVDTTNEDVAIGGTLAVITTANSDVTVANFQSAIDANGEHSIIRVGHGSKAAYMGLLLNSTDTAYFGIDDNPDDGNGIYVNESGQIGIGNKAPSNNLYIEADSGDEGITIHSAGDTSNAVIIDANRSGAGSGIGTMLGKWNGTTIGYMGFFSGADTTNKDDGVLKFATTPSGGSATVALTIGSDQNATFAGDVTIQNNSGTVSYLNLDADGDTDSKFRIVFKADKASDGNGIGDIQFFNNGASPVTEILALRGSTDIKGDLVFNTSNSERLRIDEDGLATFGGDVKVTDNLIIDSTAGNPANQKIQFHDDNVGLQRASGSDRTANGNSLYVSAFEDIVFSASGAVMGSQAERMRIDGDGGATFSQSVDGDAFIALDNVAGAGSSVNETAALRLNLGDGSTVRGGAKITAKKELDYSTGANMDASLMFSVLQNNAFNDALFISSAGRLGLGDSEPLAKLHIQDSSSGAVQAFIINTNGATNSSADLAFGNWSGAIPTGTGNPGPQAKISAINTDSGTAATDLVFSTYGSATLGEYMRITSDGKIGINTDAPYNLLHIRKSAVSGSDAHDDDLLVIEENGDHCNINMISDTGSYLMFSDATRNVANLNYQHSSGEMGIFSETTYFVNVADGTRFKLDANSRISLSNNDSGNYNTIFGNDVGDPVSGQDHNTFIGHNVAATGTMTNAADKNTVVGSFAFNDVSTGNNNVAIGYDSLAKLTTGHSNVAIGAGAGDALVNGVSNVIIGKDAEANATDGGNCIVIGATAIGQDNNSVTLGNDDVTDVYMASDSGATVHCGGVRFPATFSNETNVNTLDDYEEGTGSPTVSLTGSGSVTLGSSAGNAWTKIGNIVHFQFEFSITGVSSPVGALTVALPFASAGTYYSAGSLRVHSETFDGSPFVAINPSATVAQLKCSKTGSGTTDITPTAGTRYFFGQITYRAA